MCFNFNWVRSVNHKFKKNVIFHEIPSFLGLKLFSVNRVFGKLVAS